MVIIVLLTIVIANVPVLFFIYQDIWFATIVPLPVAGGSILFGIFIEYSYFQQSDSINIHSGILPLSRFISGFWWPILFAWDDILLQSDDLGRPWFWSMIIGSYFGWIIGVVTYRNYTIKKKTLMPFESVLQPNQNDDQTESI